MEVKIMNNKILTYIGMALFIGLLAGYGLTNSNFKNSEDTTLPANGNTNGQGQNAQPSRENCLTDDCLLVEDLEYPVGNLPAKVQKALDEAINDEYKALSTYEAVIAKFGTIRPFSMIKGAEQQHIALLKALYDKYDLVVPENTWPSKVSAPATLQEACQIGVDAEIANAALYKEDLLPAVKEYEDITVVFENLMDASKLKHLPAFDRCN
jgi:hypothetical protein